MTCRHTDWLIDPPVTDHDVAELEHEALVEHRAESVEAYIESMLAARADRGCYGCQGTGRLRWAGIAPNPCSCVLHSPDCEPESCAADCLYRRSADGLTRDEVPA